MVEDESSGGACICSMGWTMYKGPGRQKFWLTVELSCVCYLYVGRFYIGDRCLFVQCIVFCIALNI